MMMIYAAFLKPENNSISHGNSGSPKQKCVMQSENFPKGFNELFLLRIYCPRTEPSERCQKVTGVTQSKQSRLSLFGEVFRSSSSQFNHGTVDVDTFLLGPLHRQCMVSS